MFSVLNTKLSSFFGPRCDKCASGSDLYLDFHLSSFLHLVRLVFWQGVMSCLTHMYFQCCKLISDNLICFCLLLGISQERNISWHAGRPMPYPSVCWAPCRSEFGRGSSRTKSEFWAHVACLPKISKCFTNILNQKGMKKSLGSLRQVPRR